ncbi:MAG: glycosyltransferase family 39 protein [Thermoflexales bacterium]|nr:glycosyltransferase family 39 protein [Thermoflexales bacterium]
MKSQRNIPWAVILLVLLGALLRWWAIGPMSNMLSYDEAYYGLDALSLIEHPRLTPFLPANHGRESLWCYILIPFITIWGARPFALRLAAALVGILTLATMYRFSAEILNRRAAFWTTLALALCQWHVHQSRMAIRALLLPLIGTLAFGTLLRAIRTNRHSLWALSGVWIGLMLYTYFSSVFWIAVALSILGWEHVIRENRPGSSMAILVAIILFLPMLTYGMLHPQDIFQRPDMVRISSLDEFWNNLRLWGQAWFREGDPDARYNPIRRPVVDTALIPYFLSGLVFLWRGVRRRWYMLLIIGLAVASLLPSLLTQPAPHFLRAVGLVIPVALIVGLGAWGWEMVAYRLRLWKGALLLLLVPYIIAGVATWREVNARWLHHPEVFTLMEQHINQASNFVQAEIPPNTSVYFSPFSLSHPVVAFRRADLAPRPVGAFDSHICLVIPDTPAVYISVTLYEPDFQQKLAQWADISLLLSDPEQNPPRYAVFQAVRRSDAWARSEQQRVVFGDEIEMQLMKPIPAQIGQGETITIYLGLRALQPLQRVYSVFVHLYGNPPPWEGGHLWAQGDNLVCEPYPSILWRTNEWILQPFYLSIPDETPPGQYAIAVGVYEAPAGDRLPLREAKNGQDFWIIQTLEVTP